MKVRRQWALALLPAALGLAAALALDGGLFPETILVVRLQASVGTCAAFFGLLASAGAFLICWRRACWQQALRQATDREQQAQAGAHRRFIRRLDHELKNPLTAIHAGLANLEANCAPIEGARASLANVRRQAERLSSLAHDLRKLADLETCEVEQAPVDLKEIILEAVELAKSLPGREQRTIQVGLQTVPWPLSPVEGDRDLLLLALYNLLGNALKFSPEDAAVEVRASEDGVRATIEVADTGPGIAAEDLPHLGEELYRGQGAHGIEGSGLGLALVQRIVARLGGEVAIRSRLGQGTVVTLRLPLGQR